MGRLRRPLGESMADDDQISVSDDSKILKIVRLKCLEQQQKIQLEEIKNLENELESLQENQNEVDGDFLRSQSDFDVNKCLNAEKFLHQSQNTLEIIHAQENTIIAKKIIEIVNIYFIQTKQENLLTEFLANHT